MKIIQIFFLILATSCGPLFSSADENLQKLNQFQNLVLSNPENLKIEEEKIFHSQQKSIAEWFDKNGNLVKQYGHSERSLGLLSYIPLLSFLLPRNYKNYEIIITYNSKNEIINLQSFYGKIRLESESNCHEAVFSCVTKVR